MRLLIIGASGSGTTTLGQALAKRLAYTHLDLDDYYWMSTSPPYQIKRDGAERLSLCLRDLRASSDAVVSGSLLGWGKELEDSFDLVVFLYLAVEVRLQRLRDRENARFGAADPEFLSWAAQYDEGPAEGRSLAKHKVWLEQRTCPVVRIEGDLSVDERVRRVLESMPNRSFDTDAQRSAASPLHSPPVAGQLRR